MIPAVAETVRLIFRRYAELGSVGLLRAELDRRNIRSKCREGAGGRLAGGQKFSRGALYLMLQNRLYRGEVAHKGNVYPGQHDAIVDAELWQTVQEVVAQSASSKLAALAVGDRTSHPQFGVGTITAMEGSSCRSHSTRTARSKSSTAT